VQSESATGTRPAWPPFIRHVEAEPPYGLADAGTDIAFAMTGDVYRNVRALKQIRSLAARGHSVTALSLAGDAPPIALPDAVRVRTMPFPAGSGPGWFLDVHRGMRDMLSMLRPRHVHASDLYVLPACAAHARAGSRRLSYDARELYPHVASTAGKPWSTWFWRLLEGYYIRRAHTVFTVSNRIADHLAKMYAIPRPTIIFNAPDVRIPPTVRTDIRSTIGLDSTVPLVVHAGQIRAGRGVDLLVGALPMMPHIHVALLGYGPAVEDMRELARAQGTASRLHVLEPVSPMDVPFFIRTADVGVTLLDDSCLNHRYALPNKLFDYFAAGLPVVASDLPEIMDVLRRFKAGIAARPGTDQLGQAILDVIRNPEPFRDGARAASSIFNWEAVEPEFCAAFQPRT